MTTKRLLILITNLGKGGAQRVAFDHALAFNETYTVEEAVFDSNQDQRIYNSGLPLHDLRRNDLLSRLGPIGRLLGRSIALHKLVSDGDFDMVISHMDGANWVNVLSCSSASKLLVVHGTVLNDQGISRFRQWFRRYLIFPLLYNWADKTVGVSIAIARELKMQCHVRNVCTIENFFDIKVIKQKAELPIDNAFASVFSQPNVLISSGRLAEQKKQTYLIDILVNLLQRGVNTRLVILGDGELRENLLEKCHSLKLRTFHVWDKNIPCSENYDVYFLGYVNNPYQYLARSTLFLFPSGWEGFPLALCEAMIANLPALSSDCPTGPREILAPNTVNDNYALRVAEIGANGVLLPMIESKQDLLIWIDAVEDLLKNGEMRAIFIKNGEEEMNKYDRHIVINRWHNLIGSVSAAT